MLDGFDDNELLNGLHPLSSRISALTVGGRPTIASHPIELTTRRPCRARIGRRTRRTCSTTRRPCGRYVRLSNACGRREQRPPDVNRTVGRSTTRAIEHRSIRLFARWLHRILGRRRTRTQPRTADAEAACPARQSLIMIRINYVSVGTRATRPTDCGTFR